MFYRSRGFGLVEVLVAMTIGLILLGGAISMLSTNKWTYKVVEQQGRIQENARFALETISRDLRAAGYFGCVDYLNKVANQISGTTAGSLLDTSAPVNGLENYDPAGATANKTWYPSANTVVPAGIVTGSDAISIRYLDSANSMATIAPFMTQPSDAIQTNAGNGLTAGDIVAITDCDNADIFQVTGPADPDTSGTIEHNTGGAELPGNANPDLSKSYDSGATVLPMASVVYFIGTGADGRPALFRGVMPATGDRSAMNTRELIQGVEHLHILYGKDTTGDEVPDSFLKAGAAGLTTNNDWDNVVNLRISLLVSSDEEIGQDVDIQARTLLDENVAAANDRRFRRVFTTTINLRNKASSS